MAKKQKTRHEDSWIKIVTIMTVIGLVILMALGMYCFMQQFSMNYTAPIDNNHYPYTLHNHTKTAYVIPLNETPRTNRDTRKKLDSMAPPQAQSLKCKVELPLEIVRSKPSCLRPKGRRSYIRDRISRLERNIELLKESQNQKHVLRQLEQRLKKLYKLQTQF